MVVGWSEKKLKTFISSVGCTFPAAVPARKKRIRAPGPGSQAAAQGLPYEVFFKDVPRPRVVESYFDAASAIDVHNHARQGAGLALEIAWRTTSWWKRLYATVVLGMIEVDAFLTFRHFYPRQRNAPTP